MPQRWAIKVKRELKEMVGVGGETYLGPPVLQSVSRCALSHWRTPYILLNLYARLGGIQWETFIPKELTVKMKGKHINRINEEHQDQMNGKDMEVQDNHCGWSGQGMLCRGGGSWAGSSKIGWMWVVGVQRREAFGKMKEERVVAWKREDSEEFGAEFEGKWMILALDHRMSAWRHYWPRLWKDRPRRRLGLSCGPWRAEKFLIKKAMWLNYNSKEILTISSFFPYHTPLIRLDSPLMHVLLSSTLPFVSSGLGMSMPCASRCHWVCRDALWYQFPGRPEQGLDFFQGSGGMRRYKFLTLRFGFHPAMNDAYKFRCTR